MKRSSRMVREVYPEIEAENDASQAQGKVEMLKYVNRNENYF